MFDVGVKSELGIYFNGMLGGFIAYGLSVEQFKFDQ